MKAGSFNIHEYLGKLHNNVDEQSLGKINEQQESVPDDGMVIPEDGRKAYDWLKKEFQRGKTEVKVEMSSHEFKPGYNMDTNQKSVNDFKPGMYGNSDQSREKKVPFPETKFPGGESKKTDDNAGNLKPESTSKPESAPKPKNESEDGKEGNDQKPKIKVEAKTATDKK